jgi:methyl-accepting chemotaxis protein
VLKFKFSNLKLKTRIYSGYVGLILMTCVLAGFAVFQFMSIDRDVAKMAALASNTTLAVEIVDTFDVMRERMLRYSVSFDPAALNDQVAAEARGLELLQQAIKATLSDERRVIYTSLVSGIQSLQTKRQALTGIIQNLKAERELLFASGDELSAQANKLVQAVRAGGNPSAAKLVGDVDSSLLLVRVNNWRFQATRDPNGPASFEAASAKATAAIVAMEKSELSDDVKSQLGATKSVLEKYASGFHGFAQNALKSSELFDKGISPQITEMTETIGKAKISLVKGFADTKVETQATIASTITMQEVAILLAILLGGLLAYFVIRSIVGPVVGLSQAMDKLVAGDTGAEIPMQDNGDEIAQMAKSLHVFRDAAIEKVRADQGTLEERQRNAEAQRQAEEDAIDRERAMVSDSIGAAVTKLAEKDLTYRITSELPEAYRKLQSDFNHALEQIEQAVTGVASSTAAIQSGTSEIASASDDLSRRTEQQAASLEETAASLDEITATVKKSAEGAAHALEVALATKAGAEKSGAVVVTAVEAMAGIEKSSKQIGQIIGVIDEIAFQSNLLALNAGVEAARAGDAGRGFAVVASEVRALAQRSADAAKEIKGLISTSTAQVEQGVKLVSVTGESLGLIISQVGELNNIMADIAAGAQEQATGLHQVNIAMNQMDQVTQQNAAMVEEQTAASHSLGEETDGLSRLIGQFHVGGKPADLIRGELKKAAPHASAPKAPSANGAGAKLRAVPAQAVPARKVAASGSGGQPRPASASSEDWQAF